MVSSVSLLCGYIWGFYIIVSLLVGLISLYTFFANVCVSMSSIKNTLQPYIKVSYSVLNTVRESSTPLHSQHRYAQHRYEICVTVLSVTVLRYFT